MPKFTFKCEHEGLHTDKVEITNITEFRGETLDEVLENFERFLKGSGYFFDGQLNFVKEDDNNDDQQKLDLGSTPASSHWPFPLNERPA